MGTVYNRGAASVQYVVRRLDLDSSRFIQLQYRSEGLDGS